LCLLVGHIVDEDVLEKLDQIISEFTAFKDWEDRYKHLINLGKQMPDFPEEHRLETNKVKGCQSQVWLVSSLERYEDNYKINFLADSDASIMKGIVALLTKVYSGLTPDEILGLKADFIDQIGLRQHLSMSRANGLNSMLKQINLYAYAYQQKIKMGLV